MVVRSGALKIECWLAGMNACYDEDDNDQPPTDRPSLQHSRIQYPKQCLSVCVWVNARFLFLFAGTVLFAFEWMNEFLWNLVCTTESWYSFKNTRDQNWCHRFLWWPCGFESCSRTVEMRCTGNNHVRGPRRPFTLATPLFPVVWLANLFHFCAKHGVCSVDWRWVHSPGQVIREWILVYRGHSTGPLLYTWESPDPSTTFLERTRKRIY